MAKDEVFPVDENDDDVVVTIEMDDGSEVTCEILTIFDVKDQDYIALLPYEENGKEVTDDTVYIYRYLPGSSPHKKVCAPPRSFPCYPPFWTAGWSRCNLK